MKIHPRDIENGLKISCYISYLETKVSMLEDVIRNKELELSVYRRSNETKTN